jgi:putative restriction endonuclease
MRLASGGREVNLYVAVTDNEWFQFHAARSPDEVNFWRPGGAARSVSLQPGEPFLFKLHAPDNFIAGGGFFFRHTQLPLSMAWRVFGEKNGCADHAALRTAILRYRQVRDVPGADPLIGCTILAVPFFFPREMWIPAPAGWSRSIVQGKQYDARSGTGREVWSCVMERLVNLGPYRELEPELRKKGPLYLVEGRVGQAAFRTSVMDAYHRRCAITLERTMPALEASHIKPYSSSGPNRVSNGLLLRADLHQIFDEGYITVSADFTVHVSKKIREEFENGREYYRLNGTRLDNLPDDIHQRPLPEYLEWHNQHIFRG